VKTLKQSAFIIGEFEFSFENPYLISANQGCLIHHPESVQYGSRAVQVMQPDIIFKINYQAMSATDGSAIRYLYIIHHDTLSAKFNDCFLSFRFFH
jgi:hypothetical protein